jgi:hypothetical protein
MPVMSKMAYDAPVKPWSVAVFETHRSHQTSFVKNELSPQIENKIRIILVRAPVKSGKREIVEYTAMRDYVTPSKRVHAFISAWHRIADDEQRTELAGHNLTVFSIRAQKNVDEFIVWLTKQLEKGYYVVIHLDECDFGSGSKQILSKLWKKIRILENITTILYSATPEEVLYSGEVEDVESQEIMDEILQKGCRIEYIPPQGFCGPSRFLEENLVHEAIPFFEKKGNKYTLTSQGQDIVKQMKESLKVNPKRNLFILRLSYSSGSKKINKAIYQFLSNYNDFPELSDFIVRVDKSEENLNIQHPQFIQEKIQWSKRVYWTGMADVPTLIVIDQGCSRSTELTCHDRIFAWHDYRNIIQYSTSSQAGERPNHYETTPYYDGFQPIHIYGHVKTFKLSARQISYETYLNHEWEKRKITRKDMYHVRSTITKELHPSCTEEGLNETVSDRLLQELGCFADISLSARVAGRMKEVPEYEVVWKPVTLESWDTFVHENNLGRVSNPFVSAKDYRLPDGTWQGMHRIWRVLDCREDTIYDVTNGKKLDLGATGGDRIKICYKDGNIGVAIVTCNGYRLEDTLKAYKSMYG